ncbi:flagellar assembly protein FliW [Aneurinibacillus danicus]|uniref:Flagellar assembly factor FliW n=1 Tax=Aneurinibacillus danicus TaxID=267746 RepID=A0A511V9U6_9BACL|nr:flagellar assembly protein FliW [Aneurinibacillus danicus]GEN35041.1 flagellar assembly factor FliW [Aneurinibacillus danicus]
MPLTLESSLLGTIAYEAGEVYTFADGIPGFPHLHEFIFRKIEDSPFTVMHAIQEDTCFFLIDPFTRYADYECKLPAFALEQLKIESQEDVLCYTIVVLREPLTDSTTNLSAPIVLNVRERLGMQLALENEAYSIRTKLFAEAADEKVGK